MNFELTYRADLGNAHSPFRVISQPSGHEVGWINDFLDQCCIQGLRDSLVPAVPPEALLPLMHGE